MVEVEKVEGLLIDSKLGESSLANKGCCLAQN